MDREQETNNTMVNAADTTDSRQGNADTGVGTTDTTTADDQQAIGRERSANEYTSTAPAASMLDGQIKPGVMVSDAGGETIGNVLEYDEQGGRVVVRKGWLFSQDTEFPLDAIGDKGANGIFLKQTIDELRQQYSDRLASPVTGPTDQMDATDMQPTRDYTSGPSSAMASDANTTRMDANATRTAEVASDTGTTRTAEMAQPVQEGRSDQTWQPTQAVDTADAMGAADIRVPVYEEQLVAGTREGELGRVHLHKEVTTEQESIPVTLRREQVTVERVPGQGQASADALQDAFKERDIDVPVMGEEAVAGKQVREVEEVRLHKNVAKTQAQVTDTVRKESVVIDDGVQGQGGMITRDRTTTSTDTPR